MERYSLIHTKLPREFVLLQGTGCRWGKCTFCNNSTSVRQDPSLAQWFASEVYPQIKEDPKIEVLMENTDLGVGKIL